MRAGASSPIDSQWRRTWVASPNRAAISPILSTVLDFMSTLSRILTNVSRYTTDPSALIPMLDAADALPGAAELRARSYQLLDVTAGARVADVGCGAGRAVAELHEQGVAAIGVDPSEQMITVARRRWPDLEFRTAAAEALPFADGELAGYRADKVYHVLADPSLALEEAKRVLSPGARIVLLGQDWDTIVIDSDQPALTRTLVHARADTIASPRVARHYRNLLLDNGFADVTVEVHTAVFTDSTALPILTGLARTVSSAGRVSHEDAERWITEQAQRAEAGRLFAAMPLFLAAGTR